MVNDIRNFNNEHIIKCYSVTQSNIPEEPHYISSIPPTAFINGQDESRCYVNSSFQVILFNTFFGQLIMNIDCDKSTENLDNSEYEYRSYFHKIMTLQVIQKIFCEMLIGGRFVFALIRFSKSLI